MTRQKSDDRVVPDGDRKAAGSGRPLAARGGKGVTVNQQVGQLQLAFATAECLAVQPAGAVGGADGGQPPPATRAVPQAKDKGEETRQATMEGVIDGLEAAFEKVASNDGAPGPDGMSIEEVRRHLPALLSAVRIALHDGRYTPGDIRRVWIPKAGGGQRGLGIPNVVDRMVQEATRAVLEPLWEPTFHPSSHGFRPGRSCHTAIAEAKRNVEEGFEWVVDIDLEKFFDQVNHQRLMARVATRVHDRRLLVLLGAMLKTCVVMPNGVRVSTDEGVPQGGPLSPLLSNIVLDELDIELAERGHRFVRYADDCNIYVRSERAGQRVMTSITDFISRRLRLKVNAGKSAVARPEERHFLGFRLRVNPMSEDVEVRLSKRSKERLVTRIAELTPGRWGNTLNACIRRLNAYLNGWFGFFGICTAEQATMQRLDKHIRRRLRAILLHHWRRPRTIVRKLIARGVRPKTAWTTVYTGSRAAWDLSHRPAVDRALPSSVFAAAGLVSLLEKWKEKHTTRAVEAPLGQLGLFAGWGRS